MLELVGEELLKRVSESIRSGRMSDQVAAVGRLFKGTMQARIATLAFEVAGPGGRGLVGGQGGRDELRSTSSCARPAASGAGRRRWRAT